MHGTRVWVGLGMAVGDTGMLCLVCMSGGAVPKRKQVGHRQAQVKGRAGAELGGLRAELGLIP